MSKAKHRNMNAGFCRKIKEGESIDVVLSHLVNFTKRLKKTLLEREAYTKPSEERRKRELDISRRHKFRKFQKEREDSR